MAGVITKGFQAVGGEISGEKSLPLRVTLAQPLKVPLVMVSISSFLVLFSISVLPLSAIANPDLDCLCLLMYYGVY